MNFEQFSTILSLEMCNVDLIDLVKSFPTLYATCTFTCPHFHFSISFNVPSSQSPFRTRSPFKRVFTCKIWRRYCRERASQSLPKISQKDSKVRKTVRINIGILPIVGSSAPDVWRVTISSARRLPSELRCRLPYRRTSRAGILFV